MRLENTSGGHIAQHHKNSTLHVNVELAKPASCRVSLACLFIEHIQLCKLSNTGLSIHFSHSPTLGEESCSSVVFGLCIDSINTVANYQRTIPLEEDCMR